ncbi:hypothetical protein C6502_06655 [Candidatus Poribacteria bacterium]|nr:MAG: hypothetical protein C6502_06655 [Candidatus Poribacteria bacterium]
MKSIFYGFCLISVVVSGLVFYFALERTPVVETIGVPGSQPSRFSGQNSPRASVAEQKVKTPNKKKCACCREKLAQSRKVAEQRIQARKAWAREMFANYGYEEGMKRIAAKDPELAKQIQQLLEPQKTVQSSSHSL